MVPKKITPDQLADTIVELRYDTKYPFEILLGIFFSKLDDTYNYENKVRFNRSQAFAQPEFTNGVIKIQFSPQSIVFNCEGDYIGWEAYKNEIVKVLKQLDDELYVTTFNRIGIRYVSEYEDSKLKDIINFQFTFNMPEIISDDYSFRTSFKQEEMIVTLNFHNNVLVHSGGEISPQKGLSSVVDIDVIHENLSGYSFDNLLDEIDNTHKCQKELFFKLVKPEFLERLNPEY